MTVTSQDFVDTADGDGVSTQFSYTKRWAALADLRLEIRAQDGSRRVPTFTVTGDEETKLGATFEVTSEVPAATDQIVMFRDTALLQTTNYTQGNFPSQAHEDTADRLVMAAQERADEAGRTLRFEVGSDPVAAIPPLAEGRALVGGANGQVEAGPTVTEMEGHAQTAQAASAAAAGSQAAAAASAGAASGSAAAAAAEVGNAATQRALAEQARAGAETAETGAEAAEAGAAAILAQVQGLVTVPGITITQVSQTAAELSFAWDLSVWASATFKAVLYPATLPQPGISDFVSAGSDVTSYYALPEVTFIGPSGNTNYTKPAGLDGQYRVAWLHENTGSITASEIVVLDTTLLTFTASIPDDQVDVATNAALVLTFDDDVDLSGTISEKLVGGAVDVTWNLQDGTASDGGSVSVAGNVVTLTRGTLRTESTGYAINTSGIVDTDGNPLQGGGIEDDTTLNFTTVGATITLSIADVIYAPAVGGNPAEVDVEVNYNGADTLTATVETRNGATVLETFTFAIGAGAVPITGLTPASEAADRFSVVVDEDTGALVSAAVEELIPSGSELDFTHPTIVSAVVSADGLTVTLTYSEDIVSADPTVGLTVRVESVAASIASHAFTSGTDTVVLTMAAAINQGDTVDVNYVEATGDIEDEASEPLEDIVNFVATNNSTVGGGGPVGDDFDGGSGALELRSPWVVIWNPNTNADDIGIVSDQLAALTGTPRGGFLYNVPVGNVNQFGRVTFKSGSGSNEFASIIIRYVDALNWLEARFTNGGKALIYENVAGTLTLDVATNVVVAPLAPDDVLEFAGVGSVLQCKVNGTVVSSSSQATPAGDGVGIGRTNNIILDDFLRGVAS